MSAAQPMLRVVLSIDVEEEGLFGGRYASQGTVKNAVWLERLVPLLRRVDMPVTLLCTHSIFDDAAACRTLDSLRTQCRVEVGAHLHHWSTPPLESSREDSYRNAGTVPPDRMEKKLHALLTAGRLYAGQALTSFRMGRWDLHRCHWPLLAAQGIHVDASVRPLHCGREGGMPDHFGAPAHPYKVRVGAEEIFEAPLTCVPLMPPLLPLWQKCSRSLRSTVQKWGTLATLPVYHPLWALRWITHAQLAQGQRVLSLTWHSSEMMPGGAPHVPDAEAARKLLWKLEQYLLWLRWFWPQHGPGGAEVRGVTLEELRKECPHAPVASAASGDWCC